MFNFFKDKLHVYQQMTNKNLKRENQYPLQWYATKVGAFIILILAYYGQSFAQNEIDFTNSPREVHDSLHFELMRRYFPTDKTKAKPYALTALHLSRKHDHKNIWLKSLNALGVIYESESNYDSAIYYYDQAVELGKRTNNQERLMYTYCNLGITYFTLGIFDQSLDNSLRSLELSRLLERREVEVSLLNNIGLVYSKMNNNEQALEYYRKCLAIVGKSENGNRTDLKSSIAFSYINMRRYLDALNLFNELLKSNPPSELRTVVHYGIAVANFNQSNIVGAKKNIRLALDSVVPDTYRPFVAKSHCLAGEISYREKDYDNAIKNLNNGLAIANEIKSTEVQHDLYLLLSKVYAEMGQYKRATIAKDQAYILKDSLFNEKFAESFKNIHLKVAKEKSDKIILGKEAEIIRKEAELERQRLVIMGSSLLACFALIIVFLLWRGTVIVRRSRNALKNMNQSLLVANKTIASQYQELEKVNRCVESLMEERTVELRTTIDSLSRTSSELDTFILRISQEVREPLVSLKGVYNVALSDVKDPLALNYFTQLEAIIDRFQDVFNRFLTLDRLNHAKALYEQIQFPELINDILEGERVKGIPEKISVTVETEPSISFQTDLKILRLILQNLLSNAIKFYDPSESIESFVQIKIHIKNSKLHVDIIDNGIGIDNERKATLFKMSKEHVLTQGLGLYLTKMACDKLGATIRHTTTKEGFTQFTVTFPSFELKIKPVNLN